MENSRWTLERAKDWGRGTGWKVGCNFTPSTAINALEMWQAETFDGETIRRELSWAAELGFSVVRVFLHDLAWRDDREGFLQRLERFLDIAGARSISVIFVFFDDCWNTHPVSGPQPPPVPGVHNPGWVESPGLDALGNSSSRPELEAYVKAVVSRFRDDPRILLWDLYNEPGNFFLPYLSKKQPYKAFSLARILLARTFLPRPSLDLLKETFAWARSCGPSQPLTAGIWFADRKLNRILEEESDVISFHNYNDATDLEKQITRLRKLGRPLVCTEYLARPKGSFETLLPVFRREGVSCCSWGLVAGKTQTYYSWTSKPGSPMPEVWFHDLFRPDGTPYREEEVGFIRSMTCR